MKLCIIIVNWNAREFLRQCLRSVRENTGQVDRIKTFVVDNASSDRSAEMVCEQFPWVSLVRNEQNVGFAKANNQVLRKASSSFVLLLNPDTEIRGDALKEMLDYMEGNPEVAAVGARLLNSDGSLQHSCHPRPTLLKEFWRLFHLDMICPKSVYSMDEWNLTEPRPVEVIDGSCLMLRRKSIEEVGLLDESFFIYSEEVDLCDRLRMGGWKIYWVPKAQVLHHGGQSTRQVRAEMFIRLYQAKILYFRKHNGLLAGITYKLILGMASIIRQILVPMGSLKTGQQRRRNLTVARSYRRLLKELPRL